MTMIKENELRIGNWINPDKPYQITPNSFQNAHLGEFDELPIPLTAEWLKSFGFNDLTGGWYGAQGSEQHWKLGSVEFQTLGDNNYHLIGRMETKFLYVHQLQNLYFALTGTELELK